VGNREQTPISAREKVSMAIGEKEPEKEGDKKKKKRTHIPHRDTGLNRRGRDKGEE